MYSILHTGSPTKYLCNTDGSIEKIGEVLNKLRFPYAEVERFYAQFVMSLLTGNGDLHTDNIAILTAPGKNGMKRYCLSPLFDPAPMRAYRGRYSHNVLSALPFGGGDPSDTTGSATPEDLFDRMMSVAKAMGINDMTGSLEPGKMADVVLWNGNPLSVYTRPEKVWIDGALMYDAMDRKRRPVSDFELGQPGAGDVK